MIEPETESLLQQTNESTVDSYVQHLQRKYLTSKEKSGTELLQRSDSNEFSPSEIVKCSPSSSLTASEKQHYRRAMKELKHLLKIGESKLEKSVSDFENNRSVQQPEDSCSPILTATSEPGEMEVESTLYVEWFQSGNLQKDHMSNKPIDVPPLSLDHNTSQEDILDSETTLTQSVSLPTLASDFTASTSEKPRKSVRISLEPTTFLESEFSTGIEGAFQGPGILRAPSQPRQFETMDVKIIHAELMNIHMKLNQKSLALHEFQIELEDKEQLLEEREQQVYLREEEVMQKEQELLLTQASFQRAKNVMSRLQGVEIEVEEKFRLLRECHANEIEKLNSNLSEKTREYKRIKSSFDTLKSQNDELKAQENEQTSVNEKLRIQNHKLKKRLENLQRKHEFNAARNPLQTQVLADRTNKSEICDKQSSAIADKTLDRSSKVWGNAVEALSASLDWVSEVHLKPCTGKLNSYNVGREMTVDRCLKILPLLVDVVRYLPLCLSNSKQHLPFLRFIYWSLYHLEDAHHALLSSTARRIGEELIRPSSLRPVAENEALSMSLVNRSQSFATSVTQVEGKVKNQYFFNSSNSEVRMLSSLIIIKTLHQVDVLAQAFLQLKKDLKQESSRQYFLDYSATQSLFPYMTYKTNKSLIGSAIDVMLQMSMESDLLPAFLEQCSCESWFRAVSSAIRSTAHSTDASVLEKISVLLQKLSKIKSNKKFFDILSLGRTLQEHYRECDPSSTFLSLNLRSILFNLNMIKSS